MEDTHTGLVETTIVGQAFQSHVEIVYTRLGLHILYVDGLEHAEGGASHRFLVCCGIEARVKELLALSSRDGHVVAATVPKIDRVNSIHVNYY